MHYTYILKLGGDKFYIGYTNNLERRTLEHQKTWDCKLVYYEAYSTELLARNRERKLKYYGSAWRGLKQRLEAKRAG